MIEARTVFAVFLIFLVILLTLWILFPGHGSMLETATVSVAAISVAVLLGTVMGR